MNNVITLSGVQQARLIREGQISAEELYQAHLDHIARVNPAINAVIETLPFPETIPDGPLHGVPFSVKDSIEIAGYPCTAGTYGRRNTPVATEDATLVARMRAAGAVPIARTNLPDLLFAFESDNHLFGRTNNPYDLTRTSGGSSGGEAALIASCGSPFGLGSDAAGSVRVPAAFCGIASIKPTSGCLCRKGHYPPAGGWIEALWQIGPMARHVEDLIALMPLLGARPCDVNMDRLRIAFYAEPADDEVSAVVRAAATAVDAEEARPECFGQAYDLEMKLLGADGGDSLRSFLKEIGSETIHPLLRGWLDKLEAYRTDLRGFQHYWAEWDEYRAKMRDFMRRYDAIICPAYAHPALPHGQSIRDENFRGFIHTMAYNVAGYPAAVVRCGESKSGLPIAVQIAASPWQEGVALALALRLEKAFGGWKPPAPKDR